WQTFAGERISAAFTSGRAPDRRRGKLATLGRESLTRTRRDFVGRAGCRANVRDGGARLRVETEGPVAERR
ncbi:MAG TPA: hypothetical protein VGQ57_07060, partial [Polyangiaceae bacterium]|nr:hypothetical protein [Polyangiaceae bacterium]